MLGRLIGEMISIRCELAPDLGCILADPGQLEQVLVNLTVNARDAMPQGGRLIITTANVTIDHETACAAGLAAPGACVSLTVTDDGCGMDAPTVSHIFEPFFTTKELGKGTGLGLATVYGIVRQSSGGIRVQSVPGKGTTFQILLPRQLLCAEEISLSPVREAPSGGNETILVVEDEALVRKVALRILEGVGYRVLAADSGVDGLHLFRSHSGNIDLVLTDMVMPHMSGHDFVSALRQIRPTTRVIFMSGYSGDAAVMRNLLAPDTGFIGKPFRSADLVTKVREVLNVQMTHPR
jgi:CheY-like chemotaxis protein